MFGEVVLFCFVSFYCRRVGVSLFMGKIGRITTLPGQG